MNLENSESPAVDSDWASPSHVKLALLLLVTLLGIYLSYLLALPFLPSLVWAVGLAVLAAPYQNWLESRFGMPGLSALCCTLILGLLVVIPLAFAIQQLAVQAGNGASLMESKIESGEWRQAFASQPNLERLVDQIEKQWDISGIAKALVSSMSGVTMAILKGSIYQLIDLGLTFYFLFFFLRDRTNAIQAIRKFSPLTVSQTTSMVQRVNETICATVYGSFVVAAVQGIVLGATFWSLGLPAPFLWGMIMACLALAPMAGAVLVWGPAAIFLALEGNWIQAMLLVVSGVLVIVVIDNLLRPVLVGKQLQMHTVPVFISVVGGMLVFGACGILLGPVVLTITQVLLELQVGKAQVDLGGA